MRFKPDSSTDDMNSRHPGSVQSKIQSEKLYGCMQSTSLSDSTLNLTQFTQAKGEKELTYPEAQMLEWAGIRSF